MIRSEKRYRELVHSGRRIRILHVVDSLSVGGLENGVVTLINALDDHIFRNSICCLRNTGGLQDRLRDPHVKVHELHQKLKDNLLFKMKNILVQEKIDIIHSNGYGTFFDSAIGAQLAGTPFMVHCVHGIYWRDMVKMKLRRRLLQRFLALQADKLYAVADFLREYYLRVVGVSPRRISIIYNGVDVEKYSPLSQIEQRKNKVRLGFPADEIVIGSVGTLYWVKDPETLLEAAHLVLRQRDDVSFLWVGDGPLKERLQTRAREYGIDRKVLYLGSRDDVSDVLAAVDIFALPSLTEGLSYSILEAMASGLPVVATQVGGNAELIQNQRTGFLVPTRNPEMMANQLLRLISNRSLRLDMGMKARQRVEQNFNLSDMVQRYQKMYLTGLFGISDADRILRAGSDRGVY
jgi:sugar transferase (PEP-CTERM/EpsH1 system associated)